MNIFSKTTSYFSGMFQKRGESMVGIDIGSSAIKVLQARKHKGSAILETYGTLALGPYGESDVGRTVELPRDKIVAAMRDLIREADITTDECAISLPIKTSLTAFIEMPDLPERQLASMIPIEARKYIPVPISEVALDWMIIPKSAEVETNNGDTSVFRKKKEETEGTQERLGVLLVAIHKSALEQYRQIAEALKLNVKFLELEIFSTLRSVLNEERSPFMIFDMGASTTKFYLVDQGVVSNTHTVNRGAQEITVALSKSLGISFSHAESIKRSKGLEETLQNRSLKEIIPLPVDHIFSEASRLLMSFQKRHNKVVKKIILVGGGALLTGFIDFTKEHFDPEVVSGDPFQKFEASAYLGDMLKLVGPEFAVSAGLALRALQEME